MSRTTVLNLDAKLGFDVEEAPAHTKTVTLFGRDWDIVCDLNSFALSNVTTGDPAAVVDFILGLIVESQRNDFSHAISRQKNFDAVKLGALLTALVEIASERPTTPPSGFSPGGLKSTSARKSAASSAKVRAVRSTS